MDLAAHKFAAWCRCSICPVFPSVLIGSSNAGSFRKTTSKLWLRHPNSAHRKLWHTAGGAFLLFPSHHWWHHPAYQETGWQKFTPHRGGHLQGVCSRPQDSLRSGPKKRRPNCLIQGRPYTKLGAWEFAIMRLYIQGPEKDFCMKVLWLGLRACRRL